MCDCMCVYLIICSRYSPLSLSFVQDPVVANGQQGLEAVSAAGERCVDEAVCSCSVKTV